MYTSIPFASSITRLSPRAGDKRELSLPTPTPGATHCEVYLISPSYKHIWRCIKNPFQTLETVSHYDCFHRKNGPQRPPSVRFQNRFCVFNLLSTPTRVDLLPTVSYSKFCTPPVVISRIAPFHDLSAQIREPIPFSYSSTKPIATTINTRYEAPMFRWPMLLFVTALSFMQNSVFEISLRTCKLFMICSFDFFSS